MGVETEIAEFLIGFGIVEHTTTELAQAIRMRWPHATIEECGRAVQVALQCWAIDNPAQFEALSFLIKQRCNPSA
jgi:hypothetical protein